MAYQNSQRFYHDIYRLSMAIYQVDGAVRKTNASSEDDEESNVADLKEKNEMLQQMTDDSVWEGYRNELSAQLEQLRQEIEQLNDERSGNESSASELYREIRAGSVQSKVSQMESNLAVARAKVNEILQRNEELSQKLQKKQEEEQDIKKKRKLLLFALVLAYYQNRLAAAAIFFPNAKDWKDGLGRGRQFAVSGRITNPFSLLNDYNFSEEVRQMRTEMNPLVNSTEEKEYDFTKTEDQQQLKEDTADTLHDLGQYEKHCADPTHKDSKEYKKMMAALHELTGDMDDPDDQQKQRERSASVTLEEWHEKLHKLRLASKQYAESKLRQGGTHGVPRREARLVLSTALFEFTDKAMEQTNEAIRIRDTYHLNMGSDTQFDYTLNHIKALGLQIKEQNGADPFEHPEEHKPETAQKKPPKKEKDPLQLQ